MAMKRELEEAARRLGLIQGSFVVVSDFLAASSIVNSHDTKIISLCQAVMRAFAAESIYLNYLCLCTVVNVGCCTGVLER